MTTTDLPRPGSILGTRVTRTEDPELLTGEGRYVADLSFDEPLYAAFALSDVAHGSLEQIHLDDARSSPGVVAVWTADDLGVPPHHGFAKVHDDFARPPLADGVVRFVGEAIAMVLADDAAAAEDAVDLIWSEIDPLPAYVEAESALGRDAAPIFPAHGTNEASVLIDRHRVDFDGADRVVRGRYVNNRMAVAPMEPDCGAASVDDGGRLTFWASTQMPHLLRDALAAALGMDPADVRVVTPKVGGGFGGKAGLHAAYTAIAAAARRLGRPVVWVPSRSDDMKTLPHSRGQVQYAELGCTADGRFTGLRVQLVGDGGAYPGIGAFLPTGTRRMSHGTYDFPAIQFDVATAVTNTTPMGAYRGAGRPEATALLERLVDQAAIELGIDPIELRLRNFLADSVFPFRTLTGVTYDSGRYAHPLERLADEAGYEALRAEQAARRASGDRRLLGIGIASYVEITAGGGSAEFGAIDVHRDGTATVYAGTQSHGQGHQTAYAMVASDLTGIPIEKISLVDGDTDRVRTGGGTGGSRSLQLGGSAVRGATEAMIDAATRLAAELLEADVADIVVDTAAGTIGVAGVPAQALSWSELAARAEDDGDPLRGEFDFVQDGATFPFGAHLAVVEVDADTGRVELLRHVAVDDCGTVLNPLLVEGQQHGGIAAGVGQALFEEVRFDDDGTPVTANFADYGIMSAAEVPSFEVHSTETPSPLNPLGAKGIGEAATIGSTPAVQNAVIDALAHLGVRHIDLPCTPERVWQTVRAAEQGTLPDPWREPPEVFARLRAAADDDGDAGSADDDAQHTAEAEAAESI